MINANPLRNIAQALTGAKGNLDQKATGQNKVSLGDAVDELVELGSALEQVGKHPVADAAQALTAANPMPSNGLIDLKV